MLINGRTEGTFGEQALERIQSKFFFRTCVVLAFLYILLLNCLTPYVADDFAKMFGGLGDIISNIRYSWENYGGSLVPYIVVDINALFPPLVFDILNSAVYCMTVLMIVYLASPKKPYNTILFIIVNLLFWIFTIDFGQVILWQTGAGAYLWSACFNLLLIVFYYRYAVCEQNFKHTKLVLPLMFLLGLVAGWCTPPISGAAFLICLILTAYQWFGKKLIRPWMLTGLLGNVIGIVMLVIAPGNANRGVEAQDSGGIFEIFLWRFNYCTTIITSDLRWLLILTFAMLCLLAFTIKEKKRLFPAALLLFGGIASIYSMMLTSVYFMSGRTFFGGTVLMIAACAYCFACVLETGFVLHKSLSLFIALSLFCMFVTSSLQAVFDIRVYWLRYQERETIAESQIISGETTLELPALSATSKYQAAYRLEDFREDPGFWVNKTYAAYKGVDRVRLAVVEETEGSSEV